MLPATIKAMVARSDRDLVRLVQASVKGLFVLASISVLLLLMLSDFRPVEVENFRDSPSSGRFKISCLLVDCRTSQKGWVLTVRDTVGAEVDAFLGRNVAMKPPEVGSIIELVGEKTEDDPSFLIIESFGATVQAPGPPSPEGKD
jgi:hypothetical protein